MDKYHLPVLHSQINSDAKLAALNELAAAIGIDWFLVGYYGDHTDTPWFLNFETEEDLIKFKLVFES